METSKQQHFQKAISGGSKRQRTRALIIDTAIQIFAEKGLERGSIAEIAERAGLSNGSFYYHFGDKAALLEAIGGAVAATLVAEVDEAISEVEQGSTRVALASMLFILRGTADPAWGRLIVHALEGLGEFRDQIAHGIHKDVRIGVEQGLFRVAPSESLYAVLLGIVATAMRERLDRALDDKVERLAADALLRILGVTPAAAAQIVEEAHRHLRE